MILSGHGQARRTDVIRTTAQFFPIAGLRTVQGRFFDSSAERPGRDDTALLDEGFWERGSGSRDVLGERIILDDQAYTIIGVVSSGVSMGYLRRPDVWLPLSPRADARTGGAVIVVARLHRNVTLRARNPRWM